MGNCNYAENKGILLKKDGNNEENASGTGNSMGDTKHRTSQQDKEMMLQGTYYVITWSKGKTEGIIYMDWKRQTKDLYKSGEEWEGRRRDLQR